MALLKWLSFGGTSPGIPGPLDGVKCDHFKVRNKGGKEVVLVGEPECEDCGEESRDLGFRPGSAPTHWVTSDISFSFPGPCFLICEIEVLG